MATVLCVWELGGNLGHLSNLRLPVQIALQQGHRVVMALKDQSHARQVLGDLPVTYLQAPFRAQALAADAPAIPSFSHLLIRQCFTSVNELAGYLRAWHAIFAAVQPDLVLFEHSPTALIAAYGCNFKKVMIGNGFTAPPVQADVQEPFLPFPTTLRTLPVWAGLRQDDGEVCKLINAARSRLGLALLPHLHAIHAQVDATWLMTWAPLDHFGPRPGAHYLGIEPAQPRAAPVWPAGDGPRVFGYLQAFGALEPLLRALMARRARAVLFVRHMPLSMRRAFAHTGVEFVDAPVDLHQVAHQADWVISHGNHSTVAHFAATGVPQLLIPLYQEQLFLARRMVQHGVALIAFQDQAGFTPEVAALSTQAHFRQRARGLAEQCGPYDTVPLCTAVGRVITLLTKVTI